MAEKDNGTPAKPIDEHNPMGFDNMFPTETRGDGVLRLNNVNTGAAQGKGGFKRKLKCQQCGFLFDASKGDHSGGSLDGQGAAGAVTITADVGTLSNLPNTTDSGHPDESTDGGTAYGPLHYVGEQAFRKGGGCPLCFSKNPSKSTIIISVPVPRPSIGF